MKHNLAFPVFLAALLLAPLVWPAAPRAAEKPNVLLICVDDLKPLLGCYGAPLVQTPNVDRLAARGVLFENAYCNQAVCAPSRNALMTGLRPSTLGIYDLATNFRLAAPEAVTVAQHFKRHGYRAEALGKIMHAGHGNVEDAASWSTPHWRPTQGAGKQRATVSDDVPDEAMTDGETAAEAVRRVRAAGKTPGQPWFIAVGFVRPHLPFAAPKKYWDLYQRDAFPLPKSRTPPQGAPAFAPTSWGELRGYQDMPRSGPLNDAQTRELIHGYHAATSYMDAQLGKVLDALDSTGGTENTIIVLWGDHGWHLGDHGMWCKHTNYEQAARVPLIVCAPGVAQAGAKAKALAETVDIYPTLCELAGLPTPPKLDGASFVSALKKPEAAGKEVVFHVYPRQKLIGRAVRTDRHRLVEWKEPGASPETAILELYDYQTDPLESKNLAADQPEVVARLRGVLAQQPEAKPQWQAAKAAPNSRSRAKARDK